MLRSLLICLLIILTLSSISFAKDVGHSINSNKTPNIINYSQIKTDSLINLLSEEPESTDAPPITVDAISSADVKMDITIPVILVHGFLGWGLDEANGYKYWGGTTLNIAEEFRDLGFTVFEATVGAISSNHDRACELYAQIEGGTVDYGEEHSKEFGHNRYGKTYEPFYGDWSEKSPVHLIGHSMGGQTIRYLVELLAEKQFTDSSSEKWVRSITTISTPNCGTTLATTILNLTAHQAEEGISGILAYLGPQSKMYNFDLDQWNLEQKKDEEKTAYIDRAITTLGATKDIASWDLSPEGARELNQKVRTFDSVYYFSISTSQTRKRLISDHHIPKVGMLPILRDASKLMGAYEGDAVETPSDWWENDGVVNTISMAGPDNATIISYSGDDASPGVWNHIGVYRNRDHGDIIGHLVLRKRKEILEIYADLAKHLASLRIP